MKLQITLGDLLRDAILLSQMRLAGWQQLRKLQNGYLDSGDLTTVAVIALEADLAGRVFA